MAAPTSIPIVRVNVPDSLRGLISKSREGAINENNNFQTSELSHTPQHQDEDSEKNDLRKKSNTSSKVYQ